MNKKLYLIIQVLVLVVFFCISTVYSSVAASNKVNASQESLETQITPQESEPSNAQSVHPSEEEQSALSTETHQEEAQVETSESTEETQETIELTEAQSAVETSTHQETISTEESHDWYYATNTCDLEIRDEGDNILDTIPSYSIFKVLWLDADDDSHLWIEWNGFIGYVLNNESIVKVPDFLEFEGYFAATLCDLNLRDSDGEAIEIVPINSLVYVIGTSSKFTERTIIINMCNGTVGTIAIGNIEIIDDAICTSIAYQSTTLIVAGKLIAKSPCVTGFANKTDTPRGAFSVLNFDPNAILTDNETYWQPVDFWIRFYRGCGFHDSPRSEFGGTIYTYNGSHGCVNCPYEFAKILFENVYVGMSVYIA